MKFVMKTYLVEIGIKLATNTNPQACDQLVRKIKHPPGLFSILAGNPENIIPIGTVLKLLTRGIRYHKINKKGKVGVRFIHIASSK